MKKLLYSLPLFLALGACSNEEVINQEPVQPAETDGYYLTLSLNVPSTGISATRAGETLPGSAAEEEIKNMDLYLVDATTYNVLWSKTGIQSGTGDTDILKPVTDAANHDDNSNPIDKSYKLRFDVKDQLVTLHDALFGHSIKVVAVCNLNGEYNVFSSASGAEKKLIEGTFDLTKFLGDYGTAGKTMPMASDSPTAISTFATASTVSGDDDDAKKAAIVEKFVTKLNNDKLERVLDLGSITVERGVARLDIKDAPATTGSSKVANEDWTYKIGDSDVKIKMYSIYPFNLNSVKGSYVLRHRATGSADKATGAAELFSATATEWIVDAGWNFGTGEYTKESGASAFDQGYPNDPSTITGTAITSLTSRTKVNTDYYPWCYVPENTIPVKSWMVKSATTGDDDLKKYATGVLFKFQLQGESGGSSVGLTTENIGTVNLPDGIYKPASGNDDIYVILPNDEYMKVTPENGNYILNYYGFITHSNADDNLKYGIVRNNAYEMSVKTVDNLPVKDGELTYYLELTIDVLKWIPNQVEFVF